MPRPATKRVSRGQAKAKGDYHHGNLRRALLDAALAILAERGPEGFTLREAARRVGVDHRAAYRHFEDRDAVLAAVAEEGYRVLVTAIASALDEVAPLETRARLLAMARAYTAFALDQPATYRVMTGPRLNEGGRFPELEVAIGAAFDLVHAELSTGIENGTIAPVAVLDAALSLWAHMHGLASLVIMRRIRVRRDKLAAYTEQSVGHVVTGLMRAPVTSAGKS